MGKTTIPKLNKTTNYALFDMHELNRELHNSSGLLDSMRRHGFMPSNPLQCARNGNGKLKVIRGHNRLDCAMRLRIPVYYVVDESNCDLYDLEGDSHQAWSMRDFVYSRAQAGNPDCEFLLAFHEKHAIPIARAVSLVAGRSAGGASSLAVKKGTFRRGDMTHANEVVRITDLCRKLRVPFATSSAFVSAVSMALRIPEFDSDHFCNRLKRISGNMQCRGDREAYLEEIEEVYNYKARGRDLAVKFEALRVGKERKTTFGGHNKLVKKAAKKMTRKA